MNPNSKIMPSALAASSNYHMHTSFCDGHGDPEAFVQAALECGLTSIGFSAHAPLPFATDWNMPAQQLPSYIAEIKRLRQKYAPRIAILLGLEVDYIAGLQGPSTFAAHGLDYTIGAVHFMKVGGEYLEIDHTVEKFQTIVERGFSGDCQAFIRAYYDQVAALLRSDPPTILAHLDLVKKFNGESAFFDEQEAWYGAAAQGAIAALASSATILEVNTAPLCRAFAREPYPSALILQQCHAQKIPVTLNSDAHRPEHIDCCFALALGHIAACGYTALHTLHAHTDIYFQ